ncbi:MAG: class IV adenylate cyclase [Pseudomonadota bacterium]
MKLRNIEVKIPVSNPLQLQTAIESLADGPAAILNQRDTYFDVGPEAYLKLREENGRSSLIAYRRTREAELRPSDIRLSFVDDGPDLIETLAKATPIIIAVVKTRRLYFQGQTRIHLDQVESLGWFLELEVVLKPEQSDQQGHAIAEQLLIDLGMDQVSPCSDSYRDLLLAAD